ncbi:glutamine-hydrolyzing carbamoyl-phosphate synthase small subunit [Paenarthrobacter aurescens]|uniref:glutamine-hydrolyzing carbamoyl-phosphate synthase small subunit n=1 Tax=Paenarthrobacter aurescens TaxID=43663 RepID=UPI0011436D97|nr:glutamine-hydrolyzing carbamoyl-phosphate synthase small subunit [Paenarthrobacter aurescens]MDO6143708.1 glutamine-hydrolyzing carbamoyl-phosphate synthase small subunit [Paenarthrobacter aurescens]MDO6147556.1 glutamine-hydrolyzing carbamoyl-phosphate synthase small subunit [Paenarthrobacter aurescens]MDO6158799.1 glutamine-hydrolyzing carbamoyl-phosphate synthase small subunit [Paenarthrobacter aurescens]MDO6162783.1 glutamine-hydrolyzing carbamoyl-phosphate synthase small subunit [Paenar
MPIVESNKVTDSKAATTPAPSAAVLVLEDGRMFRGRSYGAQGTALGEAVFATGMTGYQETITDPSYARQLVVQTAPHIGNTGVNSEDAESRRIWVAGYIVRDAARRPSNWRSERSLDDELVEQGIVGIQGVDTRAITRHLREHKTMRAGIFSGEAAQATDKELLDAVLASAPMEGAALAEEVSIDEAYVVEPKDHGWEGEPRFSIAAVDLGIKAMTPVRFAERGVRVHVLPATSTLEDVNAVKPDGFFMSNGPGDPATADHQVSLLRSVLDEKLPYFGICFGNQILGRALGFGTYKLRYGHRGINQPVMDRRTGKVEITSQNHGFAVDAPLNGSTVAPEERFGRVEVSHVSLNDDVVEGLACLDIPAFSVQYHPEAAAGPHDAAYLFDRFIDLMADTKAKATDAVPAKNTDSKTEDKK